jgi:hypothetical protein
MSPGSSEKFMQGGGKTVQLGKVFLTFTLLPSLIHLHFPFTPTSLGFHSQQILRLHAFSSGLFSKETRVAHYKIYVSV